MGHLKLRKIIKRDTIWIEKGINKHKHNFILPYILEEKSPNGNLEYHNILKCDICNSFKSIPEPGNIGGSILGNLTEEQKKLPIIRGIKKHNYLIGFYDIEKIELIEKKK